MSDKHWVFPFCQLELRPLHRTSLILASVVKDVTMPERASALQHVQTVRRIHKHLMELVEASQQQGNYG